MSIFEVQLKEDVCPECVSVGGTLRWVCLTYPDPTLLSKTRGQKRQNSRSWPAIAIYSTQSIQKHLSKSWNNIWNRLSTYTPSRQRILTHRNSLALKPIRWQHCFVSFNLECVARDTRCNSDLSQQSLKSVLQMQILFVLQIQTIFNSLKCNSDWSCRKSA